MQLHYKVFGSGEPLIILHGLLGSLDNWQSLAKQYAEKYTVFIIDQRNHGKSPHSDEFSYDLMTEDLLHFCEAHHIYNTHIIGHSMGGKVAMQFAIEHSDFINKLIIADIAPVEYEPGHNEVFEALRSVDLSTVSSRKEVDEILAQGVSDFGTRQFLMKGLTRGENNEFKWKFNLKSLWDNYSSILQTFKADEVFEQTTLFIKGSKSNYVSADAEKSIVNYFPNYQLETIQDVGHWLHAENPKEFYRLSSNFLS